MPTNWIASFHNVSKEEETHIEEIIIFLRSLTNEKQISWL